MENFKNLDQTVMEGLEFLKTQKLSKVILPKKQKTLVIGSGNALIAGQIIFRSNYAVYANESNFKEVLKLHSDVQVTVVISASGSKHAPVIIQYLKHIRKKIILLTSTTNSQAEILLGDYKNKQIRVYPKLPEMYTYNFSTYLAMILPHTSDRIQDIINFLKKKILNTKIRTLLNCNYDQNVYSYDQL
jgi:D-arabinose 5-phosphate isomerase GutQ